MAPMRVVRWYERQTRSWQALIIYLIWLTIVAIAAGYIARSASTDAADAKSEVAKRYASQSREFSVFVCKAENDRWAKLRQKLVQNLVRAEGESLDAYMIRRDRTLNLVDGIYNVPCDPRG